MGEIPDAKFNQIIEAIRGIYARKDIAHDLEHAYRVKDWARILAEKEGADLEIVELAALLHDIGRPSAVEKTHAESGASLSINILQMCGYDENVITEVRNAIISHSREAGYEPSSLAAKVLYDADKLDFVGPVGLARLFAMGGSLGWPLTGENSCEQFYRDRIRKYQDNLCTSSGKRFFSPLLEYMENFWQEFHAQRLNQGGYGNTNF